MVNIYFTDLECEEAKLYFKVSGLGSRLFDAINAMPRASPAECGDHLESAFCILDELTHLRGSSIPLTDVDDFVHQTQDALQALAQKRSEMTGETDETAKKLQTLASAATRHADRLCDCLVGFTKEREKLLRQKIMEKDQEMAAEQEKEKTHSLFSRLKFWK